MAANGSKSVTVTSWDTLKFNWWIISQNVANNTTLVGWNMQLVAGSSGKISSTASKDWSVTVNGTRYSGTNTVGIGNNTTKTLASGQTSVAHNADGTKTFNYSFSQEFAITFSGSNIGTKSGSGSGTLTTIPRATTPTLSSSSVNMGSSVTINTPRASSGFTHDLAYSFAGSGWVTIATGVGTSRAWTVPDLASRIPNATSGTMTIRCITKNGSTSIGTKTVLLTVKVPTSVVPTISTVALAEATSGLAAQFGAYIQNKSKVKATITAAGAKGSTIKSYSSTLLGKTYTGNSWTSNVLTGSGTLSIVTKVTDSRGRTASKTTTFTVLAYTAPRIVAFDAFRSTSNGAAANDGTYVAAVYNYTAPSLNGGNTVAMALQRKLYGTTTWETVHTGTALTANTTTVLAGFSSDNQWDLRLTVTDWFGAASYYPVIIPTAEVILDILADGTGMAAGKVAENSNQFDIDWQLRTLGGQTPIVLEQGTDLNNLQTPNTYCGKNANAGEYLNCPIETFTFTLEVLPSGDNGQIMQRFTSCSKENSQVYERWLYSGSWGPWQLVYDHPGIVLWSGVLYMTENHTITFSKKVSELPTGIVLVFSEYYDGEGKNVTFVNHFIPKKQIENHGGAGHSFFMATSNLVYAASKYLYVKDDSIVGHSHNDQTGTGASGITYTNNRFVLRYVIGI